ncbi:MAG: maleylpyruvate isomerase family mycothiol-dependent enzyme [Ktedonobacteraceae bacterium]|nr:maleylpyruvate isomerase family mycothiol-dependent enzyme [Ktedonobacteraceae bacterium]
MKPVGPIIVTDLFEPVLERLLQLLHQLPEKDWSLPTPCEGWTVKDVALHLLADEISRLSRGRDKDLSYDLPPGPDFVSRINAHNALWLTASRRMSPRLICDLLDFTGHEVVQYFKSLDLMAINGPVSWAGPDPAPVWLDVAREYTERWHHQQHIREAVQQPGLMEPAFLTPVLDTFVRALPWTFHSVEAPEDTTVELRIIGDAGSSWFLLRKEAHWPLFTAVSSAPATIVTIDQDTAWRLFTKGIAKEQALDKASIQGNMKLAANVLEAVSIIA